MLLTIDNQIDPTTGTSKLKAVFENKDNALFPQQFVNIDVLVDTLKQPARSPERGHPERAAGHVRVRGGQTNRKCT